MEARYWPDSGAVYHYERRESMKPRIPFQAGDVPSLWMRAVGIVHFQYCTLCLQTGVVGRRGCPRYSTLCPVAPDRLGHEFHSVEDTLDGISASKPLVADDVASHSVFPAFAQLNTDHTVFVSSLMMPFFHSRLLNNTGRLPTSLPSLGPNDVVSIAAEWWALYRDFTRKFVDFATGNNTRIETRTLQVLF